MEKNKKLLLGAFLVLTALILLGRLAFADTPPILYFMYGVRVLLFLGALKFLRRKRALLLPAFGATLFSDFFFILAKTFPTPMESRELWGMGGFILAYLLLLAAFFPRTRLRTVSYLGLLPFLGVFALVFQALRPYAEGAFFWVAIITGIILILTAWVLSGTLWGFSPFAAGPAPWFLALAGIILFASDMVVAYSIFHPDFSGYFFWKEAFIWGTYVPGWTLILLASMDEEEKR